MEPTSVPPLSTLKLEFSFLQFKSVGQVYQVWVASSATLMVGNDEIDNLCHGTPPSIGASNLVDGSVPSVSSPDQLFNGPPNHFSPVALLLDAMLCVASFSRSPILGRLPTSYPILVLLL